METGTVSTTIDATQPENRERQIHGWAFIGVLAALMLTMLMAALDQTVVDTAIPRIIGELQGFSLYSWLITIYLLASTATIPIIGKLSDQFGRKWFLVAAVACFMLGSALAGLSQTMVQLICFRAIQGLGAGALQTLIFTSLADIFPPRELARWQGMFGAVFALASVIGPTVGGFITDNLSWRWIFYVNIPIGLFALVALLLWLPNTLSSRKVQVQGRAFIHRVDILGALTIAGGTICLLLGLSWGGQNYAWDSVQIIGLAVATVVLFALFFFIETRVEEPILSLQLFRNRVFSVGALLSLAQGMAMFAIVVYLPLFIQGVLGNSATSSGAVITPISIAMAIVSIFVGQLISRLGRYQILVIVGSAIMALGIFLLSTMSASVSLTTLIFYMVIMGVGLGTLFPVLNIAVQNTLPKAEVGVGTSAITFLRSMGATLATAVLGTIVTTTYAAHIQTNLPQAAKALPAPFLKAVTDQQMLTNPAYRAAVLHQGGAFMPNGSTLLQQIIGVLRTSLYTGIHEAFTVAFFLSLVIIVLTFFLKDIPMDAIRSKPHVDVPVADATETEASETLVP